MTGLLLRLLIPNRRLKVGVADPDLDVRGALQQLLVQLTCAVVPGAIATTIATIIAITATTTSIA